MGPRLFAGPTYIVENALGTVIDPILEAVQEVRQTLRQALYSHTDEQKAEIFRKLRRELGRLAIPHGVDSSGWDAAFVHAIATLQETAVQAVEDVATQPLATPENESHLAKFYRELEERFESGQPGRLGVQTHLWQYKHTLGSICNFRVPLNSHQPDVVLEWIDQVAAILRNVNPSRHHHPIDVLPAVPLVAVCLAIKEAAFDLGGKKLHKLPIPHKVGVTAEETMKRLLALRVLAKAALAKLPHQPEQPPASSGNPMIDALKAVRERLVDFSVGHYPKQGQKTTLYCDLRAPLDDFNRFTLLSTGDERLLLRKLLNKAGSAIPREWIEQICPDAYKETSPWNCWCRLLVDRYKDTDMDWRLPSGCRIAGQLHHTGGQLPNVERRSIDFIDDFIERVKKETKSTTASSPSGSSDSGGKDCLGPELGSAPDEVVKKVSISTYLAPPVGLSSPLPEVYSALSGLLVAALSFREPAASGAECSPQKACDFGPTTRHPAGEFLRLHEVWLKRNAPKVWGVADEILETVEPINHLCGHIAEDEGQIVALYLESPHRRSCQDFALCQLSDDREKWKAATTFDERALLERLRAAAIEAPAANQKFVTDTTGSGSTRRSKEKTPKRSYTQADVDAAIREYKAKRSSTYNDLLAAVKRGKPGARVSAQRMFGRNLLARVLGVKSNVMISKSPEWQTIATELGLNRSKRKAARPVKLEVAEEELANAHGQSDQNVVQRETFAILRRSMASGEAEATIDKLVRGVISDDDAREIAELAAEQKQDSQNRRAVM